MNATEKKDIYVKLCTMYRHGAIIHNCEVAAGREIGGIAVLSSKGEAISYLRPFQILKKREIKQKTKTKVVFIADIAFGGYEDIILAKNCPDCYSNWLDGVIRFRSKKTAEQFLADYCHYLLDNLNHFQDSQAVINEVFDIASQINNLNGGETIEILRELSPYIDDKKAKKAIEQDMYYAVIVAWARNKENSITEDVRKALCKKAWIEA